MPNRRSRSGRLTIVEPSFHSSDSAVESVRSSGNVDGWLKVRSLRPQLTTEANDALLSSWPETQVAPSKLAIIKGLVAE